ncbi:hypothetical protein [Micromonospora sp. NPDC005299]|uniref:hypothetical protein n=1 Tax=Micromonospora sp. NPDC005299 TaxID=3364231 RepID=UPI0036B54575
MPHTLKHLKWGKDQHMNPPDPEQAAISFVTLLSKAAALVDSRWFLLPVARSGISEAVTTYRERVYCYELYHQIRSLNEATTGPAAAGAPDYVLSGEIDKAGLNTVIDGGRHKPDMVWHIPGRWTHNAVVLEVKAADHLGSEPLRKDLKTLGAFLEARRGYKRGALLVFGDTDSSVLRRRALEAANDVALPERTRQRILLLWHPAARMHIEDLGTLARIAEEE